LDSPALVEVRRGSQIESRHRVAVAVVDPAGRLHYRAGSADLATYFRSAAKPLQTLPLVESAGVDALGLTDEELAVTCGSHAGEPAHLRAVRGILSKADLDEGALRCGVHAPVHSESAAALIREGRQPSAIHNNCSGKHAGMLAACRHRGWPTESYLEPEHPLQREIAGIVAACCGLSSGMLSAGTDGCGVPTFHATLRQVARAYAVLADPRGLPDRRADAIGRVTGVMRRNPHMIGGSGRLATEVQARLGDRLVCKGGAEALFGIGLLGEGRGIAIKIEDGNARAIGPVVVEALRQLGVIGRDEAEELAFLHHPTVRNHHGWDVGEMRAAFRLEKVS
jgi:L-asparaginase II